MSAKKFDENKPDISLLPYNSLAEISKAMMFGAKKYGRHNYLEGRGWLSLGAAMLRHGLKWVDGEDKDPESGVSHLAHVSANCIMLMEYAFRGLGNDDRYKGNNK